jgi:hypothetical protein
VYWAFPNARTSRKQAAVFGRIRTTSVRRLISSHQAFEHVAGFEVLMVLSRFPSKFEYNASFGSQP